MPVVVRRVLILACSLMLLQIASDVWPQATVPTLSGLGYIDFRGKPRFKIGDWVKYRFTSKSDDGTTEAHEMLILISGEEKFWGDDCFWVETWAGGRTMHQNANAILMSYSVFGDTAWLQHLQVYQRKTAQRLEDGSVLQDLTRRSLGGKAKGDTRASLTVITDTLGTDTARVEMGLFRCTKVGRKAGLGSSEDKGDSTVRSENWDRRTLYLSPRVPITSLVKEVDERWISRKAWKAGASADAVTSYLTRGTGTLELVAWGSGDLKPKVTPDYAQRGPSRKAASSGARPPARKRS